MAAPARQRWAILRRRWVPVVGGGLALALIGGLAIVSPGYEAQEVPRLETSIWVARESGQYARLNTDLGELDTVRSVADPSSLVQAGPAGVLFGQGNRQFWPIDSAVPADLIVDASGGSSRYPDQRAQNAPPGTSVVVAAGDWMLALTDTGAAYIATVRPEANTSVAFEVLDPLADVEVEEGEQRPVYVADAGAVADDGSVVLYSGEEGAVRRYDPIAHSFSDPVAVADAPSASSGLSMVLVGDRWVMSDPGDDRYWIDGLGTSVTPGLGTGALMQQSGPDADRVVVATPDGLTGIDLGSGTATEIVSQAGTPAAPVVVDGVMVAAWLTEDSGALWTSDADEVVSLDTQNDVLGDVQTLQPVLRTNGDRAVLNEVSSGLLWLVPSGQMIPVEQWIVDDVEQEADGEVNVDDAAEQLPPTAVPDAFGVRAGALVNLPLLYNDHDPNRSDVLSVSASSVGGDLPVDFGDLTLVAGNQAGTVRVRAPAGGTASFTYAVTDGFASSPPAAVALSVVPDDQNTEPIWCGVTECTQVWPTPQIAAGGTITVPVLNGWVDPEGDPIVLADVVSADPSAPIAVVPTADGEVAIRHTDANAAAQLLVVRVTVMDSRGATAQRDLEVAVSAAPQLTVRPGAFVALAGSSTVIDVATLVTGGSGSYRLLEAADASTRAGVLSVTPNVANGTIALESSSTGEFSVGFTVQDAQTLAERSATLRLSVLDQPQPLGVPPLTAFLRAGEDATVAVLDAVQNTSGRVLIVASVTSDTPQLTTAVVSQTHVRLRGSTPDGLPGPIGTVRYTVTDGAGNFVEGSITVFLVAPAHDTAPIAIADSATVKAGALVEIPVLENDVSPRGERIALYPDLVGSGQDGELAFVSGSKVRYLAPSEPGVYTLTYNAYLETSPERLASATISVTVLADGANRAPLPRTLVARVLAGKSVDIPVDSNGVDPDGDPIAVVELEQPSAGQGIATIGAGGDTIVYHAPEGGVTGGQVSLSYTVRDPDGETGVGILRIGVLGDDLADATPVTISDRLRVSVGSSTPLTVLPLVNDRDPSQGRLTITELIPNAPAGSPEFARLESLIDSDTSLEDGSVLLFAGDVVGTQSYVYTVESSITSSTAQGLIVVTVAESASPDRPLVEDTVVDLTTRRQLGSGLDVVSGKVSWVTGDPSTLTLSLWADSTRYSVSGNEISGTAPADGDLVPFKLEGTGADGEPVTAYGFLRIPAFDDMRVELSGAFDPVVVDEGSSKEFDVSAGVLVDSRDAIELRDDAGFAVQRANSSCGPTDGTSAQYTAGDGAPWTDNCAVMIRVDGQDTWSVLAVPIAIVPGEPQAILSSISRTINPAASETIDLYENLTTWEGGAVGDTSQLDYNAQYSGASFVVNQSGQSLTIEARADAVPGTTETIRINVSAFGGLTATITAIVGIAAPDAPRGATFSQQCAVSAPSCVVTAVGIPGEYDPFLGKAGGGLKVTGVSAGSGCTVASFSVTGTTQLSATWPAVAKPPGGTCTAVFTVQDAQGRSGTGEFTLDLQGYPASPATVSTVAFDRTSVTLEIPLGGSGTAHPPVSDVVIYEGGSQADADCAAAGPAAYRCVIGGLENGAPHTYTARAVNEIGESEGTNPHTTWAYAPPEITALTAEAVYRAGVTSTTIGVVELKISAADDAASFRVTNTGETITRTGAVTTADVQLPSGGSVSVEVIPISRFDPPTAGANEGTAEAVGVTVIGSPSFADAGSVVVNGTNATFTPPAINLNGADAVVLRQYLATESSVTCSSGDGSGQDWSFGPGGGYASGTPSGWPLAANRTYTFVACMTNGFGQAQSTGVQGFTWVPPPAPTGYLYYNVKGSAPEADFDGIAGHAIWGEVSPPTIDAAPPDFQIYYTSDFYGQSSLQPDFQMDLNPKVYYCLQPDLSRCGPASVLQSDNNVLMPFDIQYLLYQPQATVQCPIASAPPVAVGEAVFVAQVARPYTSVVATYNAGTNQWNFATTFSGPFGGVSPYVYTCTAN
jgi:hypothetical protein